MIEQHYGGGSRASTLPAARRTQKNLQSRLSLALPREQMVAGMRQSLPVQLVLIMGFFAAAVLLYVTQTSQASVLQMNISSLRDEQVALQANNTDFHTQASALQSMNRVETIATAQLKMTKTDLSSTIWVHPRVVSITAASIGTSNIAYAQRASEPLAWLRQLAVTVHDSL